LPSGDPTQGHLTLTCKIWGFLTIQFTILWHCWI
jgi:hypothetical protein